MLGGDRDGSVLVQWEAIARLTCHPSWASCKLEQCKGAVTGAQRGGVCVLGLFRSYSVNRGPARSLTGFG